jgi:flagellar biosynthesis protein FlhF
MRLRKFVAQDLREAIALVKSELGPDAMVVSTREVKRGLLGRGVEVTAAVDDDPPAENPTLEAPSLSEADVERIMAPLRSELRSIRTQLEPVTGAETRQIRSELAAMREVLSALRASPARISGNPARGLALEETARTQTIAQGPSKRVTALVGPTGAGKTTTIAKLAAHAALVERQSVALVSVDTYRVGGEQQISIFAHLIGVKLEVVRELEHLPAAIERLANFDRIFIDTAGRSPRDRTAICALVRALLEVDDLEIHLAIPAATSAAAIDGWVVRWGAVNIDRLIFTKVDEADDLVELVEAPARIKRPVSYLTTGQRVPEDFEHASAARLVELATRGFQSESEEVAA